jgi:single-stranded DNA-binding protein
VSIDCAFFGFIAADAEARTTQAGKQWVRLRVGVGKDAAIQWVSVAVFGKAAEIAAELKKADRVYCEGAIKLDSWRGNDGAERHSLAVTSFKIEKTHQIGRNRPRKQERPVAGRTSRSDYAPIGDSRNGGGNGMPNDDIPFAPEFR